MNKRRRREGCSAGTALEPDGALAAALRRARLTSISLTVEAHQAVRVASAHRRLPESEIASMVRNRGAYYPSENSPSSFRPAGPQPRGSRPPTNRLGPMMTRPGQKRAGARRVVDERDHQRLSRRGQRSVGHALHDPQGAK